MPLDGSVAKVRLTRLAKQRDLVGFQRWLLRQSILSQPRQFAQRGKPPQRNCLAKRAVQRATAEGEGTVEGGGNPS